MATYTPISKEKAHDLHKEYKVQLSNLLNGTESAIEKAYGSAFVELVTDFYNSTILDPNAKETTKNHFHSLSFANEEVDTKYSNQDGVNSKKFKSIFTATNHKTNPKGRYLLYLGMNNGQRVDILCHANRYSNHGDEKALFYEIQGEMPTYDIATLKADGEFYLWVCQPHCNLTL